MTAHRKARAGRGEALTSGEWAYLLGADKPEETDAAEWFALQFNEPAFRPGRPSAAELWAQFGSDALRAHIAEQPGTRPPLFWRFEAPEPERRRVGGTGTPLHECTCTVLHLDRGMPRAWLTPWFADYWRRDGAAFAWPPVSADDPPLYESEAAFLQRHGLLTAAERRVLQPVDFEPEAVEFQPE